MLALYTSFIFLIFAVTFEQVHLITVTISTPSGPVEGVQFQTQDNKTAYQFLGIRYAQSTAGNQRFRAPIPARNWTEVYNATQYGNTCLQPNNVYPENEDCLFLNVFTTYLPGINGQQEHLPVLCWIHGGGFIYGSGNLDPHGADRFLDHNVLVVTINYRLGPFGFLSTEDDVAPGNYGLKDQVLALQWIQDNIIAYGGDPDRVTIFGQSAGAASVHYLRQSSRASDLFHGCIANSGNTINPWALAKNPRQLAFDVGKLNGVFFTNNSKTLVERLRQVDARQLRNTSFMVGQTYFAIDPLNGLPFSPTVERASDEAVFTQASYEAQMNGNFNKVPLLQGVNSWEGGRIENFPLYQNIILWSKYDLFTSGLTPLNMNADAQGRYDVGQHIKSFYFHNQSVQTSPYLANFFSDTEFVRGTVKSTVLEIPYSPVYLYRFSYNKYVGGLENGVPHAEELPFLWVMTAYTLSSPEDLKVAEQLTQMWTNFVKTGNPTPELSAEVNVIWPVANATGGSTIHYLDIGSTLQLETDLQKEQIDFWESQYGTYGKPTFKTY